MADFLGGLMKGLGMVADAAPKGVVPRSIDKLDDQRSRQMGQVSRSRRVQKGLPTTAQSVKRTAGGQGSEGEAAARNKVRHDKRHDKKSLNTGRTGAEKGMEFVNNFKKDGFRAKPKDDGFSFNSQDDLKSIPGKAGGGLADILSSVVGGTASYAQQYPAALKDSASRFDFGLDFGDGDKLFQAEMDDPERMQEREDRYNQMSWDLVDATSLLGTGAAVRPVAKKFAIPAVKRAGRGFNNMADGYGKRMHVPDHGIQAVHASAGAAPVRPAQAARGLTPEQQLQNEINRNVGYGYSGGSSRAHDNPMNDFGSGGWAG